MTIYSHGCAGHYSRVNHFNNVAVHRHQTHKHSVKPLAASFCPPPFQARSARKIAKKVMRLTPPKEIHASKVPSTKIEPKYAGLSLLVLDNNISLDSWVYTFGQRGEKVCILGLIVPNEIDQQDIDTSPSLKALLQKIGFVPSLYPEMSATLNGITGVAKKSLLSINRIKDDASLVTVLNSVGEFIVCSQDNLSLGRTEGIFTIKTPQGNFIAETL